MIVKSLPVSIEKAATAGFDGTWTISSDAVDRVGDVISAGALKSQVGREVICLWQHDAAQPVGKWANLRMSGTKLLADLKLADTQVGRMIKALLDIGTPLGASVGFRGAGKPREKGGIFFESIEIMETSVVSVPCNAEAMQVAKSFGIDLSTIPASLGDEDMAASGLNRDPAKVISKSKAAILRANRTIRI